jgi:dephospho-CoA kinase
VVVTGPIASGKSSFVARLNSSGLPTVSADDLARTAVEPGTQALERIVARFGPGVVAANGVLNRERLAGIVFADSEALRDLEAIIHPRVRDLLDVERRRLEAEGTGIAVFEIPVFDRRRYDYGADYVIAVIAPYEVRRRRLVQFRAMDPKSAESRLASGLDPWLVAASADMVVENTGSKRDLEAKADRIAEYLKTAFEK